MKTIAVYGAQGHGKVVSEIARLNGYDDIIYIDDGDNTHLNFDRFVESHVDIPIALGIGDNNARAKLYNKCLDAHLKIITLIHPSAVVSKSAQINNGTIIMAHSVVNANAHIGIGCILNSACIIEHDNQIGDFVHISPRVACAGNVTIGDLTHIGIGSTIIQNLSIGEKSIIGAGSVIVKQIDSHILAYGNPCKKIKAIE